MIEKQLSERIALDSIIVTDRIRSRQEINVDKGRFLRGGHCCYAAPNSFKRGIVILLFWKHTDKEEVGR
jgi:hypothetical protein